MLTTKWKKQNWKDYKLHDYNYDVLKRGSYTDKKISVLAGGSRKARVNGWTTSERGAREGQGTAIKRMTQPYRDMTNTGQNQPGPRWRKILLPVCLEATIHPCYAPTGAMAVQALTVTGQKRRVVADSSPVPIQDRQNILPTFPQK